MRARGESSVLGFYSGSKDSLVSLGRNVLYFKSFLWLLYEGWVEEGAGMAEGRVDLEADHSDLFMFNKPLGGP